MNDLNTMTTSLPAFLDAVLIPGARGVVKLADAMADFQRERFASLVPALMAIARGERPDCGRHWWEATKGASKDTDLATCILWLLAFSPRSLTCQIGAADTDQADELRKAAKAVLRCNEWLASAIEIQADRIINKRTESVAQIIAADIAGSHGARPDVLILNELTHVSKPEFAQNLLDNASKVPHGIVIIATNAGNLDTWQHEWRELARTSPRWTFHKFDRPAPWLEPDEIKEAETRNPRSRFLRLWWGQWLPDAGDEAVNDADLQASITIATGEQSVWWEGFTYGCGVDLAWRRDRAAVVCLGADHSRQRVRLACAREWAATGGKDIDLIAVKQYIVDLRQRFGMTSVFGDESQAVLMGQQLGMQGINFIPVPQAGKVAGARAMTLTQAFKDRVVDLFDHHPLIRDLKKLRVIDRSGGTKLEAARDENGHADLGFAFSFVLPAALNTCRAVPQDLSQQWDIVEA